MKLGVLQTLINDWLTDISATNHTTTSTDAVSYTHLDVYKRQVTEIDRF